MSPDSYIPFYGNEFLQAIEGHSDSISMGYLRCIWHYWHQTHCKGIRNNDEFLRKLARIDRSDWEYAHSIIFDNDKFFTLGEDGLWHQKRAFTIWADVKEAYEKQVMRTAAASAARWKKGNK